MPSLQIIIKKGYKLRIEAVLGCIFIDCNTTNLSKVFTVLLQFYDLKINSLITNLS